jgi:hypothetical protein
MGHARVAKHPTQYVLLLDLWRLIKYLLTDSIYKAFVVQRVVVYMGSEAVPEAWLHALRHALVR